MGSLSTFLYTGAKCKFPASLPGFDGESGDARLAVINHWRKKDLENKICQKKQHSIFKHLGKFGVFIISLHCMH